TTFTTGSTQAITSLAVIGGDTPAVAAGTDGNVFVWTLDETTPIAQTAGKPTSLAAGVDGKGRVRLVWSEADGRLRLFQVLNGAFTELQTKAPAPKRLPHLGVAFTGDSADAKSAKVGYVEGDVLKLWEPDVREAYVFDKDAKITLDPQGKSVLNT